MSKRSPNLKDNYRRLSRSPSRLQRYSRSPSRSLSKMSLHPNDCFPTGSSELAIYKPLDSGSNLDNPRLKRISSTATTGTLSIEVGTPLVIDDEAGERQYEKRSSGRKMSRRHLSFRDDQHRYRQARFSSRRVRKRVVFKHGDCNVVQGNVAKRRRRYLQTDEVCAENVFIRLLQLIVYADIFTTLVDAQWRWTLLVFAMTFLLSWLGFAFIWWLVVYAHGDFEAHTNSTIPFTPCVEDIRGFTSCFLFSVETQHTIGYGSKHTTEECPEAIFIMCIQSMTGVILQAFMVGIVFAKLSRPKKRTQTLLFSRNAVICQRDGQPCLMFRVGDMRKSHIIEAHVRAQMIKRKVTREGELLPFFQTELKVGGDGEEDKILFIWPTTIVHKIDQRSPLYHLSASDMLRERFEIIVLLEGVIESTGMTTQARSSYLPSEILWGHRFEHIITFRKETGEYEVDYTLFNNTYEVDTPLCSAAELDQVRALHRAKGERTSSGNFAEYRVDSSSSLTSGSGSGSSFASSAGGLQMRAQPHAATPPTPIPVMITAPDDDVSRRGSVAEQPEPGAKLATFYTLDETLGETNDDLREEIGALANVDEEHEFEENDALIIQESHPSVKAVMPRGNEGDCISDRTHDDHRGGDHHHPSKHHHHHHHHHHQNPKSNPKRTMSREGSRATLGSLRNDSRAHIEDSIEVAHISGGAMKKSPSQAALESRSGQMTGPGALVRRPSLTETRRQRQDSPKKTSFQLQAPSDQEARPCSRPKEIV